jgi:hypothetical protein
VGGGWGGRGSSSLGVAGGLRVLDCCGLRVLRDFLVIRGLL